MRQRRIDVAVSAGDIAPDFTLPALSRHDSEHRLSDYRGKIVVLAFWSPACSTCRRYTSYFEGLAEVYRSRGVEFLAIASQFWDTRERINAIFHRRPPRFPILLDSQGMVARRFGVEVIPTVYLLDRQGVVQYWGAIDDWDPVEKTTDINYLQEALDALLLGQELPFSYIPPTGREIALAPAAEEPVLPVTHPVPAARPVGLPVESGAAASQSGNGSDRQPAPVEVGRVDELQPATL